MALLASLLLVLIIVKIIIIIIIINNKIIITTMTIKNRAGPGGSGRRHEAVQPVLRVRVPLVR